MARLTQQRHVVNILNLAYFTRLMSTFVMSSDQGLVMKAKWVWKIHAYELISLVLMSSFAITHIETKITKQLNNY